MKIVTLKSVSKTYQQIKVLDLANLEIEARERLVILGPSGCGKTTLLRLVAGFEVPDEGAISIAGKLVAHNGKNLRQPDQRPLGMVFQDLALWPHLSVQGNLEYGLKAKGFAAKERMERVIKILDLVGMPGFEGRNPGELSGGQQQRVALARALVLEPSLVLMDEPLSSLDKDLKARLRQEIVILQESLGFTLLYVTHDPEEALAIATRQVWVKNGKIHSSQPKGNPQSENQGQ